MARRLIMLAIIIFLIPTISDARPRHHHRRHFERHAIADANGNIISHPRGCPSRAFCGCGASIRVFGKSIRSLWLAANWFRFPRTSPAPGMVAVRQHHVMVLESHVNGSIWIVYDANSGGHLTRIHPRDISPYSIRNPHGLAVAGL